MTRPTPPRARIIARFVRPDDVPRSAEDVRRSADAAPVQRPPTTRTPVRPSAPPLRATIARVLGLAADASPAAIRAVIAARHAQGVEREAAGRQHALRVRIADALGLSAFATTAEVVAALAAARGTAPTLSKRERDMCVEMKIDPQKYAEARARSHRWWPEA